MHTGHNGAPAVSIFLVLLLIFVFYVLTIFPLFQLSKQIAKSTIFEDQKTIL